MTVEHITMNREQQNVVRTQEGGDTPIFLVYGRTGWIGGLIGELLKSQGIQWSYGEARLEDRAAILEDIRRVKPTHVLNAAGVTGRPNVDWCESHKIETVRANVIGCLNLADVCYLSGIHMTYYGTGCIFSYDESHPMNSGHGFTEEDKPNFVGSWYSKSKAATEDMLRPYPNVLTLRIRMPIVADLTYPRNFITKIIKYDRVINIPNSMTVLPELLPMSLDMARRGVTGVMNFTNPGSISHNQVLALYRDYVDSDFSWENFTVEEQANVIAAPRSNNELCSSRLQHECPSILPIQESLIKYVFEPASKRKEEIKEMVKSIRGR